MKWPLRKVLFIAWKDILSESRTKDILTSVGVFALLTIIIFNFAFEPGSDAAQLVAPGILWATFTFAGVLALGRAFISEREKGCLDGLMLCPVDRDVIYLGKMLGSFVFMLAVEVVVVPIFLVLFDLPLFMPRLGLITVLATIGFVSVGSLFSALAVNTRARDILLPILFFPIVSPVIIAAVKGSAVVLQGQPWGALSSWLQILAAFDVVFLVVSALLFEYVLEE